MNDAPQVRQDPRRQLDGQPPARPSDADPAPRGPASSRASRSHAPHLRRLRAQAVHVQPCGVPAGGYRPRQSLDPSRATRLGDRLRAARVNAEFSQAGLADTSGVAKPQIQRLERGTANPTLSTLYALADALSVPVATLLPLWVAALPAAVVGAVLAGALTADTVAVLLAVTLAACAAAVIGRPRPLSRGASAIGGGVAGLAAAVTGVFGPLLGAFLVSAGLRGAELRDAIGLSFLVVGVFAVVATLALDPAWTGVALAGALLPAAVAGHALGRRAFGRVSATLHRRAVIVTVLIGASAALLPALG